MEHESNRTRRSFLQGSLSCAILAGIGDTRTAAAPSRKGWQIGCYTRPWADFDYLTAFDSIAQAGYRHLGLMTTAPGNRLLISLSNSEAEAAKIGREARDRGLAILTVYGGDFNAEKSVEAGIEGLRRLIDLSAACGSSSLLLGGTEKPGLVDAYYETVRRCCEYAKEKKLLLTVKPHGGMNATGPQCRKILEKVGHPSFRLWYDPGNIFYYSEGKLDPAEDAATVDGLVCGMSVKDYLPPQNVEVTPGTGQVNFPAVLARLKKGGFHSGPLVVECLKRGDLASLTREAEQARRSLEGWLEAL
jgi:sugar phosphate isomerase/epimerase